jgi:hypothetical protein
VSERIDIHANINVSYKKENGFIYQFIKITPNKPGNIRYFTHSRYKVGRVTEDFLQTIFIGDGEDLVFEEIDEFRNLTTIKYRIDNDLYYFNFKEKIYLIEGSKPRFDGCMNCQHLRIHKEGKDRCAFYKKFLERHKKSCVDFLEKD